MTFIFEIFIFEILFKISARIFAFEKEETRPFFSADRQLQPTRPQAKQAAGLPSATPARRPEIWLSALSPFIKRVP